jgi:hypothetical protein
VLLLLGNIYDIPYPRVYVAFLYRWISIIELDILQLARVGCVHKTNFYEVN